MPKINDFPVPKKRYHGSRWRIYWSWNYRQYTIATRHRDKDKTFAVDTDVRLISAALASDDNGFPDEYRDHPSVVEYLMDKNAASPGGKNPAQWIDDYLVEIRGKNTARWISDTASLLRKLESYAGGLDHVTAQAASAFMADRAASRTPGTHNRNLTVYRKFYSWLNGTRRFPNHPFKHIKQMGEGRDTPIVYCTPEERAEAIAFARSVAPEWPEWIAIPIAFYTGMRREEIANLEWRNVNFTSGTIFIQKTKTKTSRTLFLHDELERLFLETPVEGRGRYVVPCHGTNRTGRLNNLVKKIRKLKRKALLDAEDITRPPPSKSPEHKILRQKYDAAVRERRERIEEALERIGWNAFRHTFASLAVQNGIEIDTVAAWLGNSPSVCRRHYAQFIPRDRRDERINRI